MTAPATTSRELEAVFRIERPRLIATLLRYSRDITDVEDLAQDALLKASMVWSSDGIPANPGGWLFTVARNRLIDRARHGRLATDKLGDLTHYLELTRPSSQASASGAVSYPEVGDDMLAMMFMTCHPALSQDSRVTLTLRLVGGLSVEEIARAFRSGVAAIEQRIVRAKREFLAQGISRELPGECERDQRLHSVMEVIYLIYNEGYAATEGANLTRPPLCSEALRLGRTLANLKPMEPEVLGLLSLMELQCARLVARQDKSGVPIPLDRQDRASWDRLLIRRGLKLLDRADHLTQSPGRYLIQAKISACHARALSFNDTNWAEIKRLYDALFDLSPNYVVALNRAVAISWAIDPAAGMAELDAIAETWDVDGYSLYHASRADFLARLGLEQEAAAAFGLAASLSANVPQKLYLAGRAEECRQRAMHEAEGTGASPTRL